MHRLILMRHAKTEPWTEGLDDFARALTPRGHEDARLVAEEIVSHGWAPDLILISPSRRTRETAAGVCSVFRDERVRAVEPLYLAGVVAIEDAIAANAATAVLMLLGHNPGLHEYAGRIAAEGPAADEMALRRLYEKFPTSCAALFEAGDDEPGFARRRFKLVEVIRAAELRAD